MVFADTYLQPDAPDPVLGGDVIAGVARRHAPDCGAVIEVDESGGEARAYILEGDIVMKTQRPHRLRPRTSLAKEALFLSQLERTGNFVVPRALGHGLVEGIEYLCLSRVPGSSMAHVTLEPSQRTTALNEVGRMLRSIHEIDQSALAANDLLPGDRTPRDLRARFTGAFDRLATALGAQERWGTATDVGRLKAQRLELTPQDCEPVALHSNPGPEHVFVDPDTGRFTGLIDFADAYRSHPALDLRTWRDPGDAADLLAGYQSLLDLPGSFDEVRRTGLIITELARAARGAQSRDDTFAAIDRLVSSPTP